MSVERLGRPVEILMIEDNPGDARLAQEGLKEAKVHNNLTTVTDGEQAVAFLQRRPPYDQAPRPDLILLDLNLPRLDGREVLQQIKDDPLLRRIPVVVLTTSDADEDIVSAYDLNVNCYVTKPVDFELFVQVIRSIEDFWLTVVRLPRE